ncbi:hypothetical protein GN956_G11529 [Arapaima gigas]
MVKKGRNVGQEQEAKGHPGLQSLKMLDYNYIWCSEAAGEPEPDPTMMGPTVLRAQKGQGAYGRSSGIESGATPSEGPKNPIQGQRPSWGSSVGATFLHYGPQLTSRETPGTCKDNWESGAVPAKISSHSHVPLCNCEPRIEKWRKARCPLFLAHGHVAVGSLSSLGPAQWKLGEKC